MNDLAINSVLSQMRSLRAQSAGLGSAAIPINGTPASNFSDTLKTAIGGVASSQNMAASLATRFELGDDTVNLSDVMVAGAKSQVAFRGAVEVRNRVVAAYQDIMNMPI